MANVARADLRETAMTCAASSPDIGAPLAAPPLADVATIALFLDVDGTLIDFAERPDRVVVDASLPALLRRLSQRLDGALALISGRCLREIDGLLGLRHGAAAGLHGAELRRADGVKLAVAMHAPPELARLRAHAQALVTALPGVFVETKPNAIALHYRSAPQAAEAVHAAAQDLLRAAGAEFMLQGGNHVVELKPVGIDKGGAIAALMRGEPFAGRVPWMLGDDLTDEHAFEQARALGGVGIVVGPRRPTSACYALANPDAVRAWLAALSAHGDAEAARGAAAP